eukprot:TRINITY_DN11980_c0_g1_i1.p1 TRINITY_DN11980_c0_g1~~TRINITY_DN11980_c0_g1_i1.p1  ORF type:complete len:194 (+),score=40.43 TRINITY_DN11980_c0_g1_i1:161-742(+)
MDVQQRFLALSSTLEASANMDYIGEPVSQLEHALQAAHFAGLARAADPTLPEEAIVAALLHDIGHICEAESGEKREHMGEYGVAHHEQVGADFLKGLGFSDTVQSLVKGHVQAKRYLVGKNKEYASKLSPASTMTLIYQGGPMNDTEVAEFEQDPLFRLKLQMRTWDEQAKIVGLERQGLDFYRPLLQKHMAA